MAGLVEIINRALTKLGERGVASLDDNTKHAIEAKNLYALVRDAEISEHPWAFAKKRVLLPAEAVKPLFNWTYQYVLPFDCLRVLEAGGWPPVVMGDYIGGSTQHYTLEAGRILTNVAPPLTLLYVCREENTAIYPAVFAEALACRLAFELADRLVGGNSKKEMAGREYEQALKKAKRQGAVQLPPEMPQDGSWTLAAVMGRL